MIYVGIGLIGIFILFRLFIFITGNWRATLNSVITAYIACKQMYPDYNKKELFMQVLDGRYPEHHSSFRYKLYLRKEEYKVKAENEIEGGMSVIDKYNLPALIYTCLAIEENSILSNNKYECIEDFLNEISGEVSRQGFAQYV